MKIIGDFQDGRISFRNQEKQIDITNFHQHIAILFLNKLIVEVQEASDMTDFAVFDVFHAFDSRDISETVS